MPKELHMSIKSMIKCYYKEKNALSMEKESMMVPTLYWQYMTMDPFKSKNAITQM